jgi:hypothetical protein
MSHDERGRSPKAAPTEGKQSKLPPPMEGVRHRLSSEEIAHCSPEPPKNPTARVWITETLARDAPQSLERAFAESHDIRTALTFFKDSIATGKPIPLEILEQLRRTDAAKALLESASDILTRKRHAENRGRSVKNRNELAREKAQRDKVTAHKIAARIVQQEPELAGARKISERARRVKQAWPKREKDVPEHRTIRRYLNKI